jgi:molybdopterin-binding protein
VPQYRIAQVEQVLAMSNDTIRRYISADKLAVRHDASNRMVIDGVELAEFSREHAAEIRNPSAVQASARNSMVGLVTDVVVDGVMARVEMVAGRQWVVSLMSVEAARELDLRPGVMAVARVKATDVMVELPPIA